MSGTESGSQACDKEQDRDQTASSANEPACSTDEPKSDEASAEHAELSDKGECCDAESNGASEEVHLPQHHVSMLLDEVLTEEVPAEPVSTKKHFRFPMIFDVMLGAGLLLAMAGFTIGLFRMYVTHSAEQSINQRNYKAAIEILKGSPFPAFFNMGTVDSEEILAQALYLDAMEKIDNQNDMRGALRQLQQIRPGSKYFSLAQEIMTDNFIPSPTGLQGTVEKSGPAQEPERSIVEEVNEETTTEYGKTATQP